MIAAESGLSSTCLRCRVYPEAAGVKRGMSWQFQGISYSTLLLAAAAPTDINCPLYHIQLAQLYKTMVKVEAGTDEASQHL